MTGRALRAPHPAGLLGKQRLEFWPMLGALPDHPGPARFIGLGAELLAQGNDLDARRLLLGNIGFVLLADVGGLRLDPGGGGADDLALPLVQPAPGVLVDENADLGAVEPGIDPVLGLFMPAEIEDAGDRPAVAVDHAALERGIDLAGRGLHDGGPERLEEIAVDRRDAKLEAGEIRARDRLVEIEMER